MSVEDGGRRNRQEVMIELQELGNARDSNRHPRLDSQATNGLKEATVKIGTSHHLQVPDGCHLVTWLNCPDVATFSGRATQVAPSRSMEQHENHTSVDMFILLGLSDEKELQLILFPVFLGIYLVTLIWNLGLIIVIKINSNLHTPMYLFLSSLSFIDICYSSSISPRMLSDFLRGEKRISFMACATQYFVIAWMGLAECCLLATMAYDRYIAIGSPLQYSAIMVPGRCWKMIAGACASGFLSSLVHVVPCFHLSYCGPNIIQHFFCDIPEVVSLSCSNPFMCQMIVFLVAVFVGLVSLLVILLSYGFIAASILKISSVKGSAKALNTCASHLAAVILYYGTALSVYMHPGSGHAMKHKVLSIFYPIFVPMLNPLIYSLRNKDIKEALERVRKRKHIYLSKNNIWASIIINIRKMEVRIC
ncbi:olfactory receptor 5A1-like [Cynocephalus volans]|uniref:olfactory receptor 5A1-like n=1 Tax=Cynocephalus volans TaxID=110931 RepID=UPI002FC62089